MIALLIIPLVIFLYFLYTYWRIKKAYSLAHITYTKSVQLGKKSGKRLKVLVLGDSIGTGVGASCFENSVGGRIASHLAKKYRVIFRNASVNGSKMSNLLSRKAPKEKQDVTVILISSNDVIRFTDFREFRKSTRKVIEIYSRLSEKLIVIGPANVGHAKFLPLGFRISYLYRGPKYAKILKKSSARFKNVVYINSIKPSESLGVYKQDYYSSDTLHPNDKGHKFWFDMIKPYL